jgi:hypothetical protein
VQHGFDPIWLVAAVASLAVLLGLFVLCAEIGLSRTERAYQSERV